MAARQLNMKEIDEVRRLYKLGLSTRAISRALGVHRATIRKYVNEGGRGLNPKLAVVAASSTSEGTPAAPAAGVESAPPSWTEQVDWQMVASEVRRGTPVRVLWEEAVENGICCVQYPAFWKQLERRHPNLPVTMHRIFAPGSRAEIDYADGIDVLNAATGELVKTELFVGVLAHSRYVFAEFTYSQKSEDFLGSHVRMWEHFGGVAQVVAPDNLKSAVTRAHIYDPVVNPAYTRLAAHYGVAVVPARVRRPQDKGIVERTIQAFQRWFYFRVRHRTFTSIVELNHALKEHLGVFNRRTHRIFGRSREDMWQDERAHLIALPAEPYAVAIHHRAKLGTDCHLVFEKNFYSAPHALRGQVLDIWASSTSVELFLDGSRVALHGRARSNGKFFTDKRHYPPEHKAYLESTPESLRAQAARVGPAAAQLIGQLLAGPHPLQHLRRAQGILAFARKFSAVELDAACALALRYHQPNYRFIERLLKRGLRPGAAPAAPITRHDNPLLRGDSLFH